MLSQRQKDLIQKQRMQDTEKQETFIQTKVRPGDYIEFLDEPEHSGYVYKVSKDQWKTMYIDYGEPGKAKVISPGEFNQLSKAKKIMYAARPKDMTKERVAEIVDKEFRDLVTLATRGSKGAKLLLNRRYPGRVPVEFREERSQDENE